MTFTYDGCEYDLLDHRHNSTITNERAVEIPIALAFVAGCEGSGLEVGNVLGHYGCTAPRRIVDRYEQGVYVENFDVFDIVDRYDWIVSVSTIEHIRQGDDGDNAWASAAALLYLRGLLRVGGRMLVTVGLGQNPMLDDYLTLDLHAYGTADNGFRNAAVLYRTRTDDPRVNTWSHGPNDPHEIPAYGPTHGANAVWIGKWKYVS